MLLVQVNFNSISYYFLLNPFLLKDRDGFFCYIKIKDIFEKNFWKT